MGEISPKKTFFFLDAFPKIKETKPIKQNKTNQVRFRGGEWSDPLHQRLGGRRRRLLAALKKNEFKNISKKWRRKLLAALKKIQILRYMSN